MFVDARFEGIPHANNDLLVTFDCVFCANTFVEKRIAIIGRVAIKRKRILLFIDSNYYTFAVE